MIVKRMLDYFKLLVLIFMLLIGIILELGMISCSIDTVGNVSISSITNDAKVNTYYVAKNGSDSNPGTEAQPWLTIRKAANTLVAGDTVYVKSGTYNEQVSPANSGNSSAWINYKVYPGNTVTIDGSDLSIELTGLFDIDSKSYIQIEGFKIYNSSFAGVMLIGNCDHMILQNLFIYKTQISGIWAGYNWNLSSIGTITNIIIDNCDVSFSNISGNQEGISLVGVNGFEIKNTRVHDVQGYQNYRNNKEGIDIKVGCSNGSIYNCEVYKAQQGIYLDSSKAQKNINIYNNKLHDNYVAGLMLGAEGDHQNATSINIYNNLIYSNHRGFTVNSDFFNNIFTFINNTLYHNSDSEISIFNKGQYQQDCVIRNNILVGTNDVLLMYSDFPNGVIVDHNLYYATSYDIASSQYGSAFIVDRDPLFVNSAGYNFNLQSLSPTIDAGSSIGAPAFDYNGTSRPQGNGYDIGAFEYPVPSASVTDIY